MESDVADVWFPKVSGDEENTMRLTCKVGIRDLLDMDNDQYAYDQFGQKHIHTVAVQGQKDAVAKIENLVQSGADITARELRTGNTLLHIAARTQNYQLAEWLCKQTSVEKGAVNFNYETPYRIAFKARDIKMMQVLRINGAAYVNYIPDELSDDSS